MLFSCLCLAHVIRKSPKRKSVAARLPISKIVVVKSATCVEHIDGKRKQDDVEAKSSSTEMDVARKIRYIQQWKGLKTNVVKQNVI